MQRSFCIALLLSCSLLSSTQLVGMQRSKQKKTGAPQHSSVNPSRLVSEQFLMPLAFSKDLFNGTQVISRLNSFNHNALVHLKVICEGLSLGKYCKKGSLRKPNQPTEETTLSLVNNIVSLSEKSREFLFSFLQKNPIREGLKEFSPARAERRQRLKEFFEQPVCEFPETVDGWESIFNPSQKVSSAVHYGEDSDPIIGWITKPDGTGEAVTLDQNDALRRWIQSLDAKAIRVPGALTPSRRESLSVVEQLRRIAAKNPEFCQELVRLNPGILQVLGEVQGDLLGACSDALPQGWVGLFGDPDGVEGPGKTMMIGGLEVEVERLQGSGQGSGPGSEVSGAVGSDDDSVLRAIDDLALSTVSVRLDDQRDVISDGLPDDPAKRAAAIGAVIVDLGDRGPAAGTPHQAAQDLMEALGVTVGGNADPSHSPAWDGRGAEGCEDNWSTLAVVAENNDPSAPPQNTGTSERSGRTSPPEGWTIVVDAVDDVQSLASDEDSAGRTASTRARRGSRSSSCFASEVGIQGDNERSGVSQLDSEASTGSAGSPRGSRVDDGESSADDLGAKPGAAAPGQGAAQGTGAGGAGAEGDPFKEVDFDFWGA